MSIKYRPSKSVRDFFVPPTLKSDFERFLDTDIPNTVMDFIIYEDWYSQFEDGYADKIIRGEIYPDSAKSRFNNTDNMTNFRASPDSGIRKGDMVKDENGIVYILDWDVLLQHNNAASRTLRCNAKLDFYRYQEEVVDRKGYLIEEAGKKIIAEAMPCNAYRYEGRPEWGASSGAAGITPNALTMLTVQYNSKTKNIDIDDKFIWGNSEYTIIDINHMGMNIDGDHGTLSLQAKKTSGGEI